MIPDPIVGLILVCVMVFFVGCIIMWLILHECNDVLQVEPTDEPEPKTPELVCTCGDCWEIRLDGATNIECGCEQNYNVYPWKRTP